MTEVLFVPDLARKLGKTDAAIRAAAQRKSDAIPPPFRMGRKLAWRANKVDAWLDLQEKLAADADKPRRRRKSRAED